MALCQNNNSLLSLSSGKQPGWLHERSADSTRRNEQKAANNVKVFCKGKCSFWIAADSSFSHYVLSFSSFAYFPPQWIRARIYYRLI
jgi:hypothetical protein